MKAIIIGGGIAGTATALALHRAGIDAEVFEGRDRESDGVGAFLTVAVNGLATLRTLGIEPSSVPGIDTPRMQIAMGDGERLAAFPLGPVLADGTSSRSVRRSDLYTALRARAEEVGVPVHYGRRLVTAAGSAGGVTATFADGASADGDLLVGADGLHSRTRQLIDPRAPRPHYLGVLNAGGYATGLDLGDPGTMHMIFGARTFFSYLSDGHGGVWWFANPPRRREPARGELAAVPAEEWRSIVLDLVAGDESPARQIIEATPDLFEPWPTHDLRRVPTWHRDRMLVIGDAAHAASPSSGQGASMAIEDAAVLALCLRDTSDTATALTRYERLRRPRVTRVVREGRRNGTGKTPGPFGRTIRDAVIRRMFRRPPRRQDAHSWLYDYRVDWDSGVSPSVAGSPGVD